MWMSLDFGPHKGKTLPEILFLDPDWFFHAVETGAFGSASPQLKSQARDIDYKSRHLKIPNNPKSDLAVEYVFVRRPTLAFSHFNIVPQSRASTAGGNQPEKFPHIDMSYPRRIAPNDKLAGKAMVASLKTHVLGGKAVRINQEKREAFFSNAANFIPKGT